MVVSVSRFDSWPIARRWAVGLWSAVTLGYCLSRGIPFDRASQLLIIISAALAFSVGTTTRAGRVFADWIPFFALLYGYDYSRGAADSLGFPIRVKELYNIEISLFGWLTDEKTPTNYLQHSLYNPAHIAWWESLVALMYCSHFVVPWTIVGVLYVRNRTRWAMFARRIITMSLAALVTYIVVPAAPPWYAAKVGLGDPVVRAATRGWSNLGLPIAHQIISLGQGVVNQVAALPSLHAGTTVTISLFFWPRVRNIVRVGLVAYMSFMTFTLVFGGEHYLFDAVLGAVYAVIVEIGCRLWERRKLRPEIVGAGHQLHGKHKAD